MIYRLLQVTAFLFLPLAAMGQNLDPTVEVNRTYEGKLMETHKPQLDMAVPDSVLRFDLEFDYSVTDKPYKGAYEFSPYTVEMKPSPAVYDIRPFYLKVGAGYQLHPLLDMVWSPKFKKPFRMSVYAFNRSFVGNYWNLYEPAVSDGGIVLDRLPKSERSSSSRYSKGYDFMTRAGVDGRYDWEKGLFRFDVGYHGLQQDSDFTDMVNRFYDALDLKFGFASKKSAGFVYNVGLNYLYAGDRGSILHYGQDAGEGMEQYSSEFGLNARLGYVREKRDKFLVDLGVDVASMSGDWFCDGYDIDIVPHYVMSLDRWNLDLGVRVSVSPHMGKFSNRVEITSQTVYPDVRVEYKAIRDALLLYLDIGGDSRVNSYSDLLAFDRHANPEYCRTSWEVMDVTDEKINAVLGVDGRIGSRFSFGFKGGFAKYEDALMEGIVLANYDEKPERQPYAKPGLGYGSFDKAFAALSWVLDAESLSFDGNVEYAYFSAAHNSKLYGLFLPASLTGETGITYNWKKRLSVGLDCLFSTSRKGLLQLQRPEEGTDVHEIIDKEMIVPGYADLGVSLEYAVNRKFSVWGRGGNLLNMTVQRSIMYAEKGPYFTAGICLNL